MIEYGITKVDQRLTTLVVRAWQYFDAAHDENLWQAAVQHESPEYAFRLEQTAVALSGNPFGEIYAHPWKDAAKAYLSLFCD